MTALEQIQKWSSPEPNSGCWLWIGACDIYGYGVAHLRIDGKQKNLKAHRLSYEIVNGAIPEGLQIDHLCRVRCCVNPDHLEAVTPWVNTMRGQTLAMSNILKATCNRGHSLSEVCGQRTNLEAAVNRGLINRDGARDLLRKYGVPMTPPSKVYTGEPLVPGLKNQGGLW